METLLNVGLENFVIQVHLTKIPLLEMLGFNFLKGKLFLQVVTDQAINLNGDKRIIETVVDSTYKTKSGALNKVVPCLNWESSIKWPS